MCLVQGGSSFRVLSNSVFEYICGKEMAEIIVPLNEVEDHQACDLINKVKANKNIQKFT